MNYLNETDIGNMRIVKEKLLEVVYHLTAVGETYTNDFAPIIHRVSREFAPFDLSFSSESPKDDKLTPNARYEKIMEIAGAASGQN